MMKTFYHKLVRDRIPDIIAATGKRCETRILPEDDYKAALMAKLAEEALEVQATDSVEALIAELADVAEVMTALMAVQGVTWEQVRVAQAQKRTERGGFEGRVELLWVDAAD